MEIPGLSAKWLRHWLCVLCIMLISACGGGSGGSDAPIVEKPAGLTGCADTKSCASNPILQIGGERVAQVLIPSDYTPTTRYPLIVVLHGAGDDGAWQAAYFGLDDRVDSKQ